MKVEEARNIALILIARTGTCFSGDAFDDCKPQLSEKDRDKIILEIEKECSKILSKIEKKLNINLDSCFSTQDAVEIVLYE